MSRARGPRLAGMPDAWGRWWRARGQTERKLPARSSLERNDQTPETHRIATLTQCPLLRSLLGVKRTLQIHAAMSAFGPKRTSVESFAVMRKKLPQRTKSDKTAHLRLHYLGCENASDRQLIWSRSAPRPQLAGTLAPLVAFCNTHEAFAKSLIFYRVGGQ